MHPTLLVSVAVMGLGAVSCLFVKKFATASANPHGLPLSAEEIAAAQASAPAETAQAAEASTEPAVPAPKPAPTHG